LIAHIANFTAFAKAGSFTSYCGIAPFESSSRIVKVKPKFHPFANKKFKALLNLAAISAISRIEECQISYNQRVNELG